ncbi:MULTISPECIES: heme exporter protein CcmB [unclassified Agarivorans]|uniref:heme exporter protein CcmB n=1 Tax=unclassified Agarivorans TaxID=2636026 RepID=UPI0026E46B5A|nr:MULTISPECIES: heme exporter protein CcmB [unclassified Agarivorans]MDO6686236.1 heme exporter protein CcmB [Agarivorans sp. 3_MG-2023]MDO6716315.1 heme exporter protein CcmB [Agarivorans sp. 2_MG-2023]MDO6764769.1 heme exporter protein CcmB [Agarivorans sp. 1_MG-2023]
MQVFITVIKRELLAAFRQKSDVLNPLWFILIVITLFPIAVGPEPLLLARIAPGILWVAALLSSLLSLERLFRDDYADGSLEQMIIGGSPLALIALAKIVAHWLITGLPILLLSPLLAVLLSLEWQSFQATFYTLVLGTPVLSLIGSVGVALTVGLRKGGVLLSLLILPLYIPVLIFATSAIEAASLSLPYAGHLAIMGAISLLALTLAPFATAAALKVSIN